MALLGLLGSMLYLGAEVAKPYEGDADRATWREPALQGIIITPGPEQSAMLPPGLGGLDATDEEWTWRSWDGRIQWTVGQDGDVTMDSVGEPVPWPEVKDRFTIWMDSHDLPAPTFTDVRVFVDDVEVPAEQLP